VLHLGSMRTALFCWLYARRYGGQFVLRIEDTDRERSTPENVEAILDGLTWIGLEVDEGPFYQTRRFDRYAEVAQQWLDEGKAYRCDCSRERLESLRAGQMERGEKARYDGRCRDQSDIGDVDNTVIRFRNARSGEVVVEDRVRGRVVFQNAELDDLIIVRSDGTPTYNFTVVIDDCDMAITHVIRGDDHLNNTPRQMNMIDALGAAVPAYAHLPMILGADGAKLSKRHGAVDIRDYRKQGYLPAALLNYLVRLGWSHGDQEIFSISEMIELFDIVDVNQSASSFDPQKLAWINQQHIIAGPAEQLGELLGRYLTDLGLDLQRGPPPADVADAYRERAQTFAEMAESARYCYEDFEQIDAVAAKKHLRPVILSPLGAAREALAVLDPWTPDAIDEAIRNVAESFQIKMGKLGQPIRVSVTGGSVSPPIDVTVWLVGRDRVVRRLDRAVEFINRRAAAG